MRHQLDNLIQGSDDTLEERRKQRFRVMVEIITAHRPSLIWSGVRSRYLQPATLRSTTR
jgi:hypothetical protein